MHILIGRDGVSLRLQLQDSELPQAHFRIIWLLVHLVTRLCLDFIVVLLPDRAELFALPAFERVELHFFGLVLFVEVVAVVVGRERIMENVRLAFFIGLDCLR